MAVYVRVQFDPVTGKVLFNPVTKKALTIEGCSVCEFPLRLTANFYDITACNDPDDCPDNHCAGDHEMTPLVLSAKTSTQCVWHYPQNGYLGTDFDEDGWWCDYIVNSAGWSQLRLFWSPDHWLMTAQVCFWAIIWAEEAECATQFTNRIDSGDCFGSGEVCGWMMCCGYNGTGVISY